MVLQIGDITLTKPPAIKFHVISYFQSIFGGKNNFTLNTLVADTNPSLVSMEENNMMTTLPLANEIKGVVAGV